MKVALVGFGKMGKEIYKNLILSGDEVVSIIDSYSNDSLVKAKQLNAESVTDADVVIDFSSPECAVENMILYSRIGIPAVIGTTGWYDDLEKARSLCYGDDTRIIYSGNYSIGVALFLKIVKKAGELFNSVDGYDVSIREVHHCQKADSPSGTALMVANELIAAMDDKKTILTGNSNGKIDPEALQISSERVGSEPGLHEVVFDSLADTIKIEHHARNREGFALGAIQAARWILSTDKRGLITMDEFLEDLLGEKNGK